jgi:hypothetical protein
VTQSATVSAQALLRVARMMLGVQLLAIVLGAGLLFYLFGIHRHPRHVMLASLLTGGYVVVGMISVVVVQSNWRKRARQLRASQTGAGSSASTG